MSTTDHAAPIPPWVRERRADGWPYCPRCEEDELYSLADPPSIETIAGCYCCGWRPPGARAT